MGALWECLCFILRTLGAKDQQNATYVTLSTLLFLLAPLCKYSRVAVPLITGINAFAYMTLARLVYFLHPGRKAAGIPATWLAKAFVASDIVSFVVQAAGGAMLAGDDKDTSDLGRKIYMAGVGVQLALVLAFFVIFASFYRELNGLKYGRYTRALMWAICAVLLLIVVCER